MASIETLKKAKDMIADQFGGKDNIHTVMIGMKEVNGKSTGEVAIVAMVSDKMTAQQLKKGGTEPLPAQIVVDGEVIPTDIQIMPQPRDQRLHIEEFSPQNTNPLATHQQCQNCPIMGGSQIAPDGKNWVGTLGGAIILTTPDGKQIVGAFTNAHVTGLDGLGVPMLQPGRGSDWFAKVVRVVGIKLDESTPNYIDCALLDTWKSGGKYGSGCHTVKPEQIGLGAINPDHIAQPTIGMKVVKSGRTTFITRGTIIGIEATSYVGYDEGTAKFDRQLVIRANNGNFSAGGDSGSLILTEDMRPVGLLFAGGGGQTIANPISFVLDWAKGKFFKV